MVFGEYNLTKPHFYPNFLHFQPTKTSNHTKQSVMNAFFAWPIFRSIFVKKTSMVEHR